MVNEQKGLKTNINDRKKFFRIVWDVEAARSSRATRTKTL